MTAAEQAVLAATHKPGETFAAADGNSYKVNDDGISLTLAASKPSAGAAGTQTKLPTGGSTTDRLAQEREQLLTANNDPNTPAQTRLDNMTRIQAIDRDMQALSPRPVVARPGSTVVGADGQPLYTAEPPATAIPNTQIALVKQYIDELKTRTDLDEQQKKDAFDTWYKVNVELPATEQTEATKAQTFARGEGDKAVSRAFEQAQVDRFNNPQMQAALTSAMAGRGLGSAPLPGFQMPGNLQDIASAAANKALAQIAPGQSAIAAGIGSGLSPLQGPAPAAPGTTVPQGAPTTAALGPDPDALRRAALLAANNGINPAVLSALNPNGVNPVGGFPPT